MASFVKFNSFVENLAEGVHNFQTAQLKVALTNTAPSAANSTLSDITQINYANLSDLSLTTDSSAQVSGTYSLAVDDLTLTASGTVDPFRYIVIYNDTPTSPADPLIGYYDRGASITMEDEETLLLNFGSSLFTLV